MTNEEIREKFLSGTVAIKAQRLKKFERAINKARKDERERVIEALQSRAKEIYEETGTFSLIDLTMITELERNNHLNNK